MRLAHFLVATSVAFFVLPTACHHDDEDTPIASLADVAYQGGTTDEALADLLASAPKAGDKRARLSAPAAGSKLTDAPTFEWSFAAVTGQNLPTRQPRDRTIAPRAVGHAGLAFGIPAAHAHGTPFSGTGYLLVISSASDPKLLRAFTNATSFKPDAAAWDRVKRAGGSLKAVVTTGLFEGNKLVAGGGPFEGDPITFEISQ